MSVPIQDMVSAASECKLAEGAGCNAISWQALEDKCREWEKTLGAIGDSKRREGVQRRIEVSHQIIDGIKRGIKPLDMIDPADIKVLNNAIRIKVIQMKGRSESEIVESFYDPEFKKSGSTAVLALKIYSRDEIGNLVREYNSPLPSDLDIPDETFPDEFVNTLKKALRRGKNDTLPASRQSLREVLRSKKRNNRVLWKYEELIEDLEEPKEKVLNARGDKSGEYPYEEAFNAVTNAVDTVICEHTSLLKDEKAGIAIAEMLLYPEIIENLDLSVNEFDEGGFSALSESFNQILGIKSAKTILAAILPYLGIKLPPSARSVKDEEEGTYKQNRFSPQETTPQPAPFDPYGDRAGREYRPDTTVIDERIREARLEIQELLDYGERIRIQALRYDENGMPHDQKFLKNQVIICAAGAEAFDRTRRIINDISKVIRSVPKEAYSKEMDDYEEYIGSIDNPSKLQDKTLFLAGHARGASRFLLYMRIEWIMFFAWLFLETLIWLDYFIFL